MKKSIHFYLQKAVLSVVLTVVFLASAYGEAQPTISAKADYITCWKQPCIYVAGSEWSERNPNGVAIAVAMGTKPVVTDDQVKEVISRDFSKHGVTNIKFFFEQNDTPAIGITFHVRGGTEGLFLIDNVRDQIAAIAKRAKNTNRIFQ